tara:strand:- start:268 stop:1974 length:1707 start_codon:yes stop_codon:yes gene_type:complete
MRSDDGQNFEIAQVLLDESGVQDPAVIVGDEWVLAVKVANQETVKLLVGTPDGGFETTASVPGGDPDLVMETNGFIRLTVCGDGMLKTFISSEGRSWEPSDPIRSLTCGPAWISGSDWILHLPKPGQGGAIPTPGGGGGGPANPPPTTTITAAPTTTTFTGLAMDCTLDAEGLKISCRANGYQDGSQLTWASSGSWAYGTGSQWDFTIHDELIAPTTEVSLKECQGSNCETLKTVIDTSILMPSQSATPTTSAAPSTTVAPVITTSTTPEASELTAVCSFHEPQRRLSCQAVGQSGGSLKWTTSLASGSSTGNTFETTFKWGQFFDEIQVQLEECNDSDCTVVTWSTTVVLEPRGNCPENFAGWFTTFPLDDHTLIYEVGPPGRIDAGDAYKGHGYFRIPTGMNTVNVRMPVDATLYAGSNHYLTLHSGSDLEDLADAVGDEMALQYRLEFRTECEGLRIRFDHIAEPVPEIVALFTRSPLVNSTSGMELEPLFLQEGDLVGTKIGTEANGNAAVDFGVYDDFKRIQTAQDVRFENAACFYEFFAPPLANYLSSRITRMDNLATELCS